MTNIHSHSLSFSVGELSCQLLRTISGYRTICPATLSFLPHKHSFAELHYIIQGDCLYSAGGSAYKVHSGQLLIMPPDTDHTLSQIYSPMVYLTLSVHIQPPPGRTKSPSRTLYNALCSPTPLILDVLAESRLVTALSQIDILSRENEDEFAVQESLRGYATLLLAGLSEALIGRSVPAAALPPHLSAPQSFLIDQFFFSPTKGGATALAQQLNVTPRQLDRILLDTYGMNFREMLKRTKLKNATGLLSNKDLSIDQIAHLLGYSNSTTFAAFIKNETGQTPSQLRRTL